MASLSAICQFECDLQVSAELRDRAQRFGDVVFDTKTRFR